MAKACKKKDAQELTNLLRRIGQGEDPKTLQKEANRLVTAIKPQDIAIAEQNLIDNGYSAQLAEHLAAAFMLIGIVERSKKANETNMPGNHILRKIIAEHDLIRCFIADLEDVNLAIQGKGSMTETSLEFMKLCHIIEHLNAMSEHIEREEDVIFPYLRKHGWTSLSRTAQNDHVHLKIATDDLIRLIGTLGKKNLKEFKARLNSISVNLCPMMLDHLSHEDNILYPIAMEVIDDNKVWEKIKNICDEIGYCGVHI